MERYDKNYIEGLANRLCEDINNGNEQASIEKLEVLMRMMPACKFEATNKTKNSMDYQVITYMNEKKLNCSHSQISIPIHEKLIGDNALINSQSENKIAIAKNLDCVNQEIYNQLKKKGNPANLAKIAATGVATMEEAVAKLKNYLKK